MAQLASGQKYCSLPKLSDAKHITVAAGSSSGLSGARALPSRWAQYCPAAASRRFVAARVSTVTPSESCDGKSGQNHLGADAVWRTYAASSSWDETCLFEVSNPLADYESVDAPHTEMQAALLGNETYRSLVPLMCWTHLLDKSECDASEPLGIIIGQSHVSEASPEAIAAEEDSRAWHLPVMQMNASASIWRTLLQDAEAQPAWVKASIGMLLYGLGDIVAQAFSHGRVTSATELVGMMALGALFEGVCNPWWNSEINRRIVETGAADAARVKSLRFFLNYLVWTPLCCEFYLVYEHLITHPLTVDLTQVPLLVDALLGVPDSSAVELVEELEGFSEGLVDELQSQGVYMMGANALKVWVPPPFRPLFSKIIEAGSWTVLD